MYTGLEQLILGKLSHFLISHEHLRQALNNLQTFLLQEHSNLKIAYEDLHYYYMHGHFSFARHGNLLVIIVNVPLTLQEMTPLIQFQVIKIPLVALDAPGYYSQLVTDFDGLAYHSDARYYLTFDRILDIPENGQLDLRKTNLRLLKRSHSSCALGLMLGRLALIRQYCTYHVVAGDLVPAIYRLDKNNLLLSNISEVTLHCHKFQNTTRLIPEHLQIILKLSCDCDLETSEFFISGMHNDCDVTQHNFSFIL